jgi:hypothetical protein
MELEKSAEQVLPGRDGRGDEEEMRRDGGGRG